MADSNSSKDTQEQKPRLNQTDLPSCLNLDVLTKELWAQSDKGLKSNVMLSCLKMPKDEGPGEERRCPSYTCMSALTQRSCSAIDSMQTYQPIQCPKAGQAGGATGGRKLQLESLKLWAKSDKDFKDVDLCCSPEVLENMTNMDIKKVLKIRRRDLGNPTSTHIPLCLRSSPDHLPRIGQESSQGWMFATGVLGILGFLVILVFLGMRLWRGRRDRRKERRSRRKALRAEEGLGKAATANGERPAQPAATEPPTMATETEQGPSTSADQFGPV